MEDDKECFGEMEDEMGISTTPGSEPGASSEHYLAMTDSLEELEIDQSNVPSKNSAQGSIGNHGAIKQLILDEKKKRGSQGSELSATSGNGSSASPIVSESESEYMDSQELAPKPADSKVVSYSLIDI